MQEGVGTVAAPHQYANPAIKAEVAAYVTAATADSTRRAYQTDLRAFLNWGGHLPAAPETISAYLVQLAGSHSVGTITRKAVAIGRAHVLLGFPNPCTNPLARQALRGIARLHGRPQRQVAPAVREDVLAMLPHMHGMRGVRNRALILVGFAGAFRRSELVALTCDDVAFVKEGMKLTIRRSKTDQMGIGRTIAIPNARSHACPVKALQAWLDMAAIQSGPLFRSVGKSGRVGHGPLSSQTVATLVKEYATKAGLDASRYSGHSLRAGLITSAARAGVSSWKIREMSGHRSEAMLQRYIRDAGIFEDNAAGAVL